MHPAELKVHQWLQDSESGGKNMSSQTMTYVAGSIVEALDRQFNSEDRKERDFTVRMSNIGKAYCQLWYDKNKPKAAMPIHPAFKIQMVIGDVTEAVFKGIMKAAGVEFEDHEKVTLSLPSGDVHGESDMSIDGTLDDIKSASPWAYRNKWTTGKGVKEDDPFGYVGQLVGYAKAAVKKIGGWWVFEKSTGHFKYVPSDITDDEADAVISELDAKVVELEGNKFRRCFEDIPETFRKKPTGNRKLGVTCSWCEYRYDCWPGLKEIASLCSQAQDKPIVAYTYIAEEDEEAA